ncbi:MAG TPA: class I SAM-dependent methyltransferase [Flavobacteriales bacterium]|nr:class I SAM-dependent methyltransferase [Flavobacteriales bacterium]
MRSRYEGMWNVVRFNWPKYVLGCCGILAAFVVAWLFPDVRLLFIAFGLLGTVVVLLPLLASHVIYDRSALYRMPWLDGLRVRPLERVVNLNAGFDESSAILHERFPESELTVVDLFDAVRCTEPSIVRARMAYPPYPGTLLSKDGELPVLTGSLALVIAFLSLHEVRTHVDRVAMMKEIRRTLAVDGHLVVTEHLRDLPNALAFTIGVFHFHTRKMWTRAFRESGLLLIAEHRTAGFITTFILRSA